MTECRICGNVIRDDEDVVDVGGTVVHDQCAGAHDQRPRQKMGLWAAMGAQGQMAMGDVQRGEDT
jgi:hypothetical protein